jgi:hypothetical protein
MPDAPRKKPCRVLLIEDDQDDIFLFRRAVESAETSSHCPMPEAPVGTIR